MPARPGYDWYAAAAPDNAGQVYLGAIDVFRGDLSADGITWAWANLSTKDSGDSIHADQHAIAFDPADPSTIYCAGDGGVFRSPDRGTSWVSLNPGLGITQITYMVHDDDDRRWLLAGTQDNGTIRYLGSSAFGRVDTGDGGDCGMDQTSTDLTTATCYDTFTRMRMYRSTAGGADGTFKPITPKLSPGYQSLFYPPVGVAGSTVAIAGQSVFVSRDTGTTWTEVTLPAPLTRATALHLPSTDLVYAATFRGRVFKIAYSGGAWSAAAELTTPRVSYVSAIRVDQRNRIWATMSEIGGGQVFRSDDDGNTWTDKTGNLPVLPLTSIAFDDTNPDRVLGIGRRRRLPVPRRRRHLGAVLPESALRHRRGSRVPPQGAGPAGRHAQPRHLGGRGRPAGQQRAAAGIAGLLGPPERRWEPYGTRRGNRQNRRVHPACPWRL